MKLLKKVLAIQLIGMLSCCVPFGVYGIAFGFISVTLNTILLSIVFKKELID